MASADTNVICDEDEFSIALNKICNYVDFLERKQSEFSDCLKLAETALDTPLFSAATVFIMPSLKPTLSSVSHAARKDAKTAVANQFSEIKAADNFAYPGNWLDEIKALLSQFL